MKLNIRTLERHLLRCDWTILPRIGEQLELNIPGDNAKHFIVDNIVYVQRERNPLGLDPMIDVYVVEIE